MTKTSLFIALNNVIPKALDEQDVCIKHLIDLIKAENGVIDVHIDKHNDAQGFCIHYDSEQITLEQLKAKIKIHSDRIAKRYQHINLYITGMDCIECARIIEHALSHLPGIQTAKINYASQLLHVDYDTEKVSLDQINKRIKQLGYKTAPAKTAKTWFENNYLLFLSLLSGIFLMLSLIINAQRFPILYLILIICAYICGGFFTVRNCWQLLKQKQLDIDVLMLVAALGSAVIGNRFEGGIFAFFIQPWSCPRAQSSGTFQTSY